MKIGLPEKILGLMLVPVVLNLALILGLAVLLDSAEKSFQSEARAKELRRVGSSIGFFVDKTVQGLSNYITGSDQDALDQARQSLENLDVALERLGPLIGQNNQQRRTLVTILFLRDRIRTTFNRSQTVNSVSDLPRLWHAGSQLQLELRKLNMFEARKVTPRLLSTELVRKILLWATFFNVVVAVFLVIFFVRPIVKGLAQLNENNRRLAGQQPLLPITSVESQIAALDKGFREMVAALSEFVRKEQAMVENASDIICSMDKELRFLSVNRAAVDSLGYSQDILIGSHLQSFVAESSVEEVSRPLLEAISAGGAAAIELVLNRKDGSVGIFSCGAHWSREDEALFCVLRDITERKRVARMKQDFIAMISQDLRTPLSEVLFTISKLLEGNLGELNDAGRRTLGGAKRSASSLLNLVNEILDIEKMGSGKLTLNMRKTDIDTVAERAAELVQKLADNVSVTVVREPSGLHVIADQDRLLQVFTNLLSNAIKYSPQGGKVIIRSESCGDNCVEVKFIDKGRGIPANMTQSIFERFQQLDISDSKVRGGSGLGLAISKSIVEAHGGSIGVDSEVEKGSTFWIRLPVSLVAKL